MGAVPLQLAECLELHRRPLRQKRQLDFFAGDIKPTIGLPFSNVADEDVLFMSAECQDWLGKNGIMLRLR